MQRVGQHPRHRDLGEQRRSAVEGGLGTRYADDRAYLRRGSGAGRCLAVFIEAIDIADSGWTDVMIGRGAVGDLISAAEVRIFRIVDGEIDFGFGVRLPLTPMIGAIGTSPRDQVRNAGLPDAHGGNLDCTLIKPGSTLYLPVNVAGALLGLGDLHAAMGDGEVGNAGLEVGGSVTLRCAVEKDPGLPLPMVDTGTLVATYRLGINPGKRITGCCAVHGAVDCAVDGPYYQ